MKKRTSCPIRPILQALGYTPAALAKDLDVSRSKAQRLLNCEKELKLRDVFEISKLLEINPNVISGLWVPGEIRAKESERDRWPAAEKEAQEQECCEKISRARAEFDAKTHAEQLAGLAATIKSIIIGFVHDVPDLTADALLSEIVRQLTGQEGVA